MLKINIKDKIATVEGSPVIVCGNSDYVIQFAFDDEWADKTAKTARFAYNKGGLIRYQDIVFTGDTVTVPVLADITEVFVGVFSGNLSTTTPARIPCELSIRCGTGAPADPTPSQYDQIMALMEDMAATLAVDVQGDGHTISNYATNPHAEGYRNSIKEVKGYASNGLVCCHVEGGGNVAASNYCHAEGLNTKALGSVSHAEGNETTASGTQSHAEGIYTEASGTFAHAQNCRTKASGARSHAEGNRTESKGESSHAGGESSVSEGARSFAHGLGIKTPIANQAAFGKYNKGKTDTLFEVGNGSGDAARLNAFEVTTDGTVYAYKAIKIGNTTITETQLKALLALI